MSLFPLRKKYFVAEGDDVPQRGRRRFFALALGGLGAARFGASWARPTVQGKHTVRIIEFDSSGRRTGAVEVEKIEKPEAEWKSQLTPLPVRGDPPQRHRARFHRQVSRQPCRRPLPLRLLRDRNVRFQDQV